VNNIKAVFLDRDGTIIVDKGYEYRISELKFIPNSLKALKQLKDSGYKLFLVFGQSGIGRGIYTKEHLKTFMKHFFEECEKENVKFVDVVYCEHSPQDNCDCRKPKTLMVDTLIKKYSLNPKNCWNIGDKTADIKMGEIVGCKNILVKTGKAGKDGEYEIDPDFVAEDLYAAVNYLLKKDKQVVLKEV